MFRRIAKNFGYQEIITPIFEHTEVFERSVGDATDIIQKEMYRFTDKKGRVFALRPEGTAPVMRSFIENNLGSENQITKLFYIGNMFRYDRPQAGRSRQFSQYGLECLGTNHPYYDAETIAVFYAFLRSLGLKNFDVEVNSIGCAECSELYNKALREYFNGFLSKLCPDCQTRFEKNPKRLLDCKVNSCQMFHPSSPSILDFLDDKCKTHFEQVLKYLEILNVTYIVNHRIVRGLDYYTQTAFEFINNNLGSQNALGGGGRYDGLVKQMGGKDTPGVGFAGGISRLLLSLEQESLFQGENPVPKYFIIRLGDDLTVKAIELLNYLRHNGIYAEFDLEKNTMKAQMKAADKMQAQYCIILGEDEMKAGIMTIKNMKTGEQSSLGVDKVNELLKN
jgi:histidyl-tRNA synthetase